MGKPREEYAKAGPHRPHKLTDTKLRSLAKTPGVHSDGLGLKLRVSSPSSRSWIFRFQRDGQSHELGLGRYEDGAGGITLAQAREKAADARRAIIGGNDPRFQAKGSTASLVTFADYAEKYLKAHHAKWSPKQEQSWRSSLRDHTGSIAGLAVDGITLDHMTAVLKPLFDAGKVETGMRVCTRIKSILDAAEIDGLRAGKNPAEWRGYLDKKLSPPPKIVEPHPAMALPDLRRLMADLRGLDTVAARALQFVVLTGLRTSEALFADWSEIDLDAKVFTVPASRMKIKSQGDHRVPLSAGAIEALGERGEGRVFSGLHEKSLRNLLAKRGRGFHVHGFRSSFRDWAGDNSYAREVAEAALAHAVGSKVERAYARSDLFNRRRELMDAWAKALIVVDASPTERQSA